VLASAPSGRRRLLIIPRHSTPSLRRGAALALAAALLATGCGEAGDAGILGGKALYSQGNEELVIRHFFDDRRGGVFVDVGCSEWKANSTTYYLEKHLGWTGIGIDALPQYGKGFRENRPGTRFFSYLVTDHSGTMEIIYAAGPVSSTSSDWLKQFGVEDKVKAHPLKVPTITLNELLDQNGVSEIDLLSMDIEGGEADALAGFDIGRFQPELVCIERAHGDREEPVTSYFARNGYERIDEYLEVDPVNWYYRPAARRPAD